MNEDENVCTTNCVDLLLLLVTTTKLLSRELLYTILQLICCFARLQKYILHGTILCNINIPQDVSTCAEYPVTHYNMSLTRSSDVNQSILMLGPYTSTGPSKVEITLNSTDGIRQNALYDFQISAVSIIGSNTSSEFKFCKI